MEGGYKDRTGGCSEEKGMSYWKHMSDHYDFDGNPITQDEWAKLFGGSERFLWTDHFFCKSGEASISTVWLGIDHNFSQSGPPLIFETMIFCSCEDEYQWRYATKEEARKGHILNMAWHQSRHSYILTGSWDEVRP